MFSDLPDKLNCSNMRRKPLYAILAELKHGLSEWFRKQWLKGKDQPSYISAAVDVGIDSELGRA